MAFHADWPLLRRSTIGLAGSGRGGMAGAVARAVAGDSDTHSAVA